MDEITFIIRTLNLSDPWYLPTLIVVVRTIHFNV